MIFKSICIFLLCGLIVFIIVFNYFKKPDQLPVKFLEENKYGQSIQLTDFPRDESEFLDPAFYKLFITPEDDKVRKVARAIGPDIRKQYYWVAENIKYKNDSIVWDVDEYYQTPYETLSKRSGDCEDSAFLLASLARASGIKDVYVVLGTADYNGHAWVMYKRGKSWRILEPTNNDGTKFVKETTDDIAMDLAISAVVKSNPWLLLGAFLLSSKSEDISYSATEIINVMSERSIECIVNDYEYQKNIE